MRMRPIALVATGLTLALTSSTRADDTVSGTRSHELFERAHVISLKLDRTHATLVVQRTFDNPTKEYDQAEVHIHDLPVGAIAIGLRTQAVTNGQAVW